MRSLALAALFGLVAAAPAASAQESRSFMVTGVDRVRVDGPYDVRVVTGVASSAKVEGDRDAVQRLMVRVDGGTLVVTASTDSSLGGRRGSATPTLVTITVPIAIRAALINGGGRLSVDRMKGQRVDLSVNGAGTLRVDAIDAGELAATLTGTGMMTLGGKAARATFGSYGAGSIDAAGMMANDLMVQSGSSGNGSFAARFTARVTTSGLGEVVVAGQPKCVVSGSGPIRCGDTPAAN